MNPALPSPRLSVIIPTLNEADQISGLLQDLAALRAKGHEVVLVDGGSDDQTLDVAAARVDRLVQAQRGRAVQLNAGARAAAGDVLWFLHADTRVPADASDRLIEICSAGRPWGRFNVRLSGSHSFLRVIESMMNLRSCITGVATGDQGIFVSRETFVTSGGFPEIPLMEDIALCKVLRRRAAPACIRQPRLQSSSRRWEQHGIIHTVLLMWRLRLAYAMGVAPSELARRYP